MRASIKKNVLCKLGELLVSQGLISREQLQEALRVQAQTGGRLGSILYELGYLTVDDLLEFLGRQLNARTVNLYACEIDPMVLNLIPFEKMKKHGILPLAADGSTIKLAMLAPDDIGLITELEFTLGRSIEPVLVMAAQMQAALQYIHNKGGSLTEPMRGIDLLSLKRNRTKVRNMPVLKNLFQWLVTENASDLLLTAGALPCLKKNNEIIRLATDFLTPDQVRNYADQLMTEKQKQEFMRQKELDFAYFIQELGRFRINIYRQRNSLSIVARHIVEKIPNLEDLGLPPWIEDFALKGQGLILITGPTGHGKTTTLAAMLDIINSKRKCNIITLEDPIEYLHKHKSSNVNQREVGIDTDSFQEGLRHIFRQAPDVMVVGEMRDPESFAIAVEAAETGHLVLSTFHSNNATSAIERIIDVFPAQQQQQIRVQLAESFLLILNQRLVPAADGKGRILAYEKLTNSYRVKNLIREGKTFQIRQQFSDDFQPIDVHLSKLFLEGRITSNTGLMYCDNPSFFNSQISKGQGRL